MSAHEGRLAPEDGEGTGTWEWLCSIAVGVALWMILLWQTSALIAGLVGVCSGCWFAWLDLKVRPARLAQETKAASAVADECKNYKENWLDISVRIAVLTIKVAALVWAMLGEFDGATHALFFGFLASWLLIYLGGAWLKPSTAR